MSGSLDGFNLYSPIASAAADAYGVPPSVFMPLVGAESSWNPNAVSSAGALGLAQVLPSTAARPGYGVTPFDPLDPVQSLYGGASYLSALHAKLGSWTQAAQAYRWGINSPQVGSNQIPYADNPAYGAQFASALSAADGSNPGGSDGGAYQSSGSTVSNSQTTQCSVFDVGCWFSAFTSALGRISVFVLGIVFVIAALFLLKSNFIERAGIGSVVP